MWSVKKFYCIYLFLIFNLIVWLILFYYYYFLQLYCLIWCCLSLKFFVFVGFCLGFILYLCMCRMYWESEILHEWIFLCGYKFYVFYLRGYKFWYFLLLCNRSRLLSYYVSLCWWRTYLNVCICIFVFVFVIVTVVVEFVIIDQW